MKLAIMQPYFFPYIGYFQLINAVDKFVIYDDVNFINRGWINRNNFLINGKPSLITIPLINASQNKLINEISILNDQKLKEKILKTIEMNYKKSPFFKASYQIFSETLSLKVESISKINHYAILLICNYLGIKTEIIETSVVYNNKNLNGQDRILDICLKENAVQYINPIGGLDLYDKHLFDDKNVKLNFLKSKLISYDQMNETFQPWLSILDVLMHNSPQQIQLFLNEYELV